MPMGAVLEKSAGPDLKAGAKPPHGKAARLCWFSVYSLALALMLAGLLCISGESLAAKAVKKHNISGKTVYLGLPEGSCPLNPKQAADKLMIDGVKSSIKGLNELLLQFADCKELKQWRAGKLKYLRNFGSYQTSLKLKATDLKGREATTIQQICALYKKQGLRVFDDAKVEQKKRIAHEKKHLRNNEMKLLGIVKEDDSICAASALQRIKSDDNVIINHMNLFSITVLNGRLIFTHLYAPQDEENILARLTQSIIKLNDYNLLRNKKKK